MMNAPQEVIRARDNSGATLKISFKPSAGMPSEPVLQPSDWDALFSYLRPRGSKASWTGWVGRGVDDTGRGTWFYGRRW